MVRDLLSHTYKKPDSRPSRTCPKSAVRPRPPPSPDAPARAVHSDVHSRLSVGDTGPATTVRGGGSLYSLPVAVTAEHAEPRCGLQWPVGTSSNLVSSADGILTLTRARAPFFWSWAIVAPSCCAIFALSLLRLYSGLGARPARTTAGAFRYKLLTQLHPRVVVTSFEITHCGRVATGVRADNLALNDDTLARREPRRHGPLRVAP